jgi:integrase
VPNPTIGKKVEARIDEAIAMGTWKDLKTELTKGPSNEITIKQFADVYLQEYCNIRNTRPDFKKETLEVIKKVVGDVKIRDFKRSDAHYFEKERAKSVSGATVNRGLAVLSNLFTFALRKGMIEVHPMIRYGRIPEEEKVLRILEPAEERLLVEKTLAVDPVVGAYVGVLGETGLRMTEGLNLKWEHVRLSSKQLTVEASKNYKVRHVPLSDYAIELFDSLPRIDGNPYVFVRLSTMERLRAPRKELYAGRKAAKLELVGFHDLRHYRATQWVKHGIDIRTVKEWLGHRDIQTTMRYAHFAPGHAQRHFAVAQELELQEIGVLSTAGEKQADEIGRIC